MIISASFSILFNFIFYTYLIAYTFPSNLDLPLKIVEKFPVPTCSSSVKLSIPNGFYLGGLISTGAN